jgi:hypothetical protein
MASGKNDENGRKESGDGDYCRKVYAYDTIK